MKDKRGLYYYPFPQNKRVRMYVRQEAGNIEFRLWNQDDPKLWQEHGWVPYDTIVQAAKIYNGGNFNPNQAYDIEIAQALIKDESK